MQTGQLIDRRGKTCAGKYNQLSFWWDIDALARYSERRIGVSLKLLHEGNLGAGGKLVDASHRDGFEVEQPIIAIFVFDDQINHTTLKAIIECSFIIKLVKNLGSKSSTHLEN